MRDKIITVAALLFIGACAIFVFIRIQAHYSPPDAPAPVVFTPASTAAASPATAPRPTHTVIVRVTKTASAGGADGA